MNKLIKNVVLDLISFFKSHWKRLAIAIPSISIAGYFGLLIFNSAMQGRLVYVW